MTTLGSEATEKAHKLLDKLTAMAERGEKHESQVAALKIKQLQKKYSLNNRSLNNQRVFKVQDWADHKNLLLQCIIDSKPTAKMEGDKTKKAILVDLTEQEFIEVNEKWKFYWKKLSIQKDALFAAFVIKNKIGVNRLNNTPEDTRVYDINSIIKFVKTIDEKPLKRSQKKLA